ncbi:hypothetical protein LTR49_026158 [Elasticomyces elasticus]|nr:hypothetical protein LTR49_026158 [Elasticomyces elasticus]
MGYLNCSTPEDLYDTVYACSKTIKSLKGFQATNYTYLKLNPKNKSNRTITLDDILAVGLTTNPAIDFPFKDITTELGKLAKKKTRQGRKTKNLLEQLPAIGESLLEDVYANIYAPLRVLHDRDEDVALAAALNSEDARDATSYTSILADLNALVNE